ncbi:MAG TPA: fatty acid desaturase [Pirellulaceae bacterium]|nr:fatty acid desaturase [Pirellulaceae bacterium]HMO93087.1 fatty acid desaturase [Pirellulaceae bacterium]HMP69962.1 fatty acid desaturase [Pirellulaceae bacterium]
MNKHDICVISKDRRKQLLIESKKYAQEQRLKSWWVLLSTGFLFVGLTAIAAAWIFPWYVRLIAGLLVGLLNVRLFIIYHDYQHGAIFRDSRVVKLLMNAYGYFALNPPSVWKHSHDHHHKHNSQLPSTNIGSFPLLTIESYRNAGFWQKFAYLTIRHPLTILFGYVTVFLVATSIVPAVREPREHWDTILAALFHIAMLTLLLIFVPSTALFAVIIPFTVAGALGAYLFYAQHNYPTVKFQTVEEWDYIDAALHSSSYIKMNPVMQWFTGNIGFHHVHHLNHKIPFYRLKEAMKGIEELQTPGVTTLRPWDILHCLRLKLWDPETNRLVPLSAARKLSCT